MNKLLAIFAALLCVPSVATLALCLALPAFAGVPYKIVTASEKGTYIVIGRDLSAHVAPAAGIDLEVLPSAGSVENVRRLRYEAGVKLALVQSDVYQSFLDLAASGNADAGNLIRPLRIIAPLYNEEVYFVARADSPLSYVHEIRDAKLSVGPIGSGTALTSATLYRAMYGAPLPAGTRFLTNEDALLALIGDKSIDVAVIVAGQPAKLLVDMSPEVRKYIKLLKVDEANPATKAALRTYFLATIKAASYPNLLDADVPGLAVKAYLVTYDFNLKDTQFAISRFARALCRNIATLKTSGHPKWREVDLRLSDPGAGWTYYPPAAAELAECSKPKAPACSVEAEVLGLCKAAK